MLKELEENCIDNIGVVYANNDRKYSAIMFWRYEKTYTSFISFRLLLLADYRKAFVYYCSLNDGFHGRYINKEEVEEMKEFIQLKDWDALEDIKKLLKLKK